MAKSNKNFVIFLTLFVLAFSLPKFLLLFGAKLLFMLFILLIAFQVLLSKIKLHMSAFLGHLQTITTFDPSILLVSFFFNHMSITNLSLGQDFVVFFAMAKLKRGIGVMILSLIVFMSRNIVFWEQCLFVELSHFLLSLSSSSILDLFLDKAHIPSVTNHDPPIVAPDSLIDFSVQPPNIIDPFPSSPFNEQVEDELPNPNPELGPLLLLHLKILHKTFHLVT